MKKLDQASDRTANPYRDSSGRTLADYPRPSVAVDTALLTVAPADTGAGTLSVLQVRRDGGPGWGLPGTFLHEGERLIDAVLRALREKAEVTGLRPRQLHVFDDPARDERGWVLSVAHVDVVRLSRIDAALAASDRLRLVPVTTRGRLAYDHARIIELAAAELQARYADSPDPDHLLAKTFTLRELRLVHEAVAGRRLQRDTFRRNLQDQLRPTGLMSSGTRGRPAELFTRATKSAKPSNPSLRAGGR